MNQKDIQIYATRLATLTRFVNSEIVSAMQNDSKTQSEPYKFFYTVLFKLNNGLDTLSVLVNNVKTKPHVVDSIFILLRSLISDSATFLYVRHKSKDEVQLVSNIHELYFEHIQFTMNAVSRHYGTIYDKTEVEIEAFIQEIKTNRPQYFDERGNAKIKAMKVSVQSALNTMSTQTPRDRQRHIERHFTHYDRFSKYEHFGDLTYSITHRQFSNEITEIVEEMVDAINLLVTTMKLTISGWPDILETKGAQFDSLVTELYKAYNFE